MSRENHLPRLERIFGLPEPDWEGSGNEENDGEFDYASLGFGPADVPALIALATDRDLYDSEEPDEAYAPVHAWRILRRLHAVEAAPPLLDFVDGIDDHDDWVSEQLPSILASFGEPAVEPLAAAVRAVKRPEQTRLVAAQALRQLAEARPELRDALLPHIARPLKVAHINTPEFNGFLIAHLLDLQAREFAELIEDAMTKECVDTTICGDWIDVKVDLGLDVTTSELATPTMNFMEELVPRFLSDDQIESLTRRGIKIPMDRITCDATLFGPSQPKLPKPPKPHGKKHKKRHRR